MNIEEIEEVKKYFTEYTKYSDGAKYFHKYENFYIIISNDNEVYQLNSDHEAQGIELQTLDSLKIRFKSFTGEMLENISGENIIDTEYLFDKSLLEKAIIKQPRYIIGVDTYDKDVFAYSFAREVDGVLEILLAKTMSNETEFNKEVENLTKYFNVDINKK